VVGAGFALKAEDVPEDFPDKAKLFPDAAEWINPGDSLVVAPWGKIAAGPLSREAGILYADIDVSRCGVARRSLDVAGHYARPDVFELHVNRRPRDPIAFD
jgi:nitrilase